MRFGLARLVAFGVIVVALAACTFSEGDIGQNETTTIAPRLTTLPQFPVVYPSPPVTMQALIAGTLRISLDEPCAAVIEYRGNASCVAFPEGTTVDLTEPNEPVILMVGCKPLMDGNYVQFGGGAVPWSSIDESVRYHDLADLPREGALSDGIDLVGGCDGPSRADG